jgi:Epoxide hydrolase N terminus.
VERNTRHEKAIIMAVTKQPPDTAVRPFTVEIPQEDVDDLKRRIRNTRFPEKETVDDTSQGVRLEVMRALAAYWLEQHDWRKVETRLNALPQFVTRIDGVDIHFIHARSKHEGALPMIVTHGWPGSIIEQLRSSGRSPIRPRMGRTPRMRSTSSSRRSRDTGSPGSPTSPGGTRSGSRGRGLSS